MHKCPFYKEMCRDVGVVEAIGVPPIINYIEIN